MADEHQGAAVVVVCCMCGDVGFSDKLFACSRCRCRSQHSYCSNYYYGESCDGRAQVCDWCQSHQGSSTTAAFPPMRGGGSSGGRSEYVSGERIKREVSGGKGPGGSPSPRQSTRRYKLLKDVMY